MTLYADDPDVHVVFPVTDREGQNITISPATVMVDGFSDITATWLGDPAPVRNLKVPLYGLPPMVELKLRLVVPGDNDVPLTAKTGGVILRSSSTDWEWPGQPGGTDLGSIGSALTISAPGSYELDLTVNATVAVSTSGDVTLWVHGTGQTLTVAGQTFTIDDDAVILIVTSPREVQSAFLAGGGSGVVDPGEPEDSTPPSAVTGLSATGGEGQVTFNWTAATDAESTVGYRYRVWLTSGGATGEYVTRSSVGPVIVTGLAAGGYTVQVYAYSSGGASATASATATVTAIPVDPRVLKLSRNPLYYYPLDDDAGTTAPVNLGSGGGTAAALVGATFGSTGIAGTDSAVSLSGSSTGRINLPTAANLNGLSAFTVELLAVRTSGTVIVSGDTSDGNGYVLANSYFAIRGEYKFGALSTSGTLLTLTYDGTIARLYADGVERFTQAAAGPLSVSGAPRLGTASDGSQGFAGRIAELVIYTYCQSAGEVLATAEAHGLA